MIDLVIDRAIKEVPEGEFIRYRELMRDVAENSHLKNQDAEYLQQARDITETYLGYINEEWVKSIRRILK